MGQTESVIVAVSMGVRNTALYVCPRYRLPIAAMDELLEHRSGHLIVGDLNAKHGTWTRGHPNTRSKSLCRFVNDRGVLI